MLMPLYVLLVTSFKAGSEIGVTGQWNLPEEWTFASWAKAWKALEPSFLRTFQLAVPVALISSLIGAANGFVLSRWRFPGADVVFTLILFGMFIPYQAVMIPLGQVVQWLGIPRGISTLILVHIIYGIPICTLIFRNYYATIVPVELIEASNVDGAGLLRTFWSVILPISGPGLRGDDHLAVHLVLERLPVRDLPFQHPQRADHHRAQRAGRRAVARLRGLHGRSADHVAADAGRLRPARSVVHRWSDGRIGEELTPVPQARLRCGLARVAFLPGAVSAAR